MLASWPAGECQELMPENAAQQINANIVYLKQKTKKQNKLIVNAYTFQDTHSFLYSFTHRL